MNADSTSTAPPVATTPDTNDGVRVATSERLVSLDQFRGYTVAGMIVVNFVGGLAAIHPVLKHHDIYYSYADSIMPSFLFVCGFAYRLTMLRRISRVGAGPAYRHVIVRSLGLVMVSLVMYGFNKEFKTWDKLRAFGAWEFCATLLKSDLWETLAIIGASQVLALPFIALRARWRVLATSGLMVGHLLLSGWFNWNFVHGRPNLLDAYWGAAGKTAWDGGFFGVMMWSALLLFGSLAFDLMKATRAWVAATSLIALGLTLGASGYALSCLSTLYDPDPAAAAAADAAAKDLKADPAPLSPVWPPLERLKTKPWRHWLAEPPLVPPPKTRAENYWMMNKRIVSIPFVLFAAGVAYVLNGLFVLACDVGPLRIGLFRTFGRNALAAYFLHHFVEEAMLSVVPGDSPLAWCLLGIGVYFAVTYIMLRSLEKQGVFLRL